MREWLARIAADIKRANKWLDPSYVPKPSWQPNLNRCFAYTETVSYTTAYITVDKTAWSKWR